VIFVVLLLDFLLLIFFFNVSFLATLREKILRGWLRKYRPYLRIFSYYRYRELFVTITLSFTRYLVFSTQYFILLKLFNVPVDLMEGFLLISLVFFFVTVIPTVALTELGIRDSVAIYIFTLYLTRKGVSGDLVTAGVFSASTIIWIINLAIPAIAGTLFLSRLKFFRKNS
jgi:hypothetical protein